MIKCTVVVPVSIYSTQPAGLLDFRFLVSEIDYSDIPRQDRVLKIYPSDQWEITEPIAAIGYRNGRTVILTAPVMVDSDFIEAMAEEIKENGWRWATIPPFPQKS